MRFDVLFSKIEEHFSGKDEKILEEKARYLAEISCDVLIQQLRPFEELKADLLLVDTAGLDFLEYVLYYIQNQQFILGDIDNYQLQDILRIGLIAYHTHENNFVDTCTCMEKIHEQFIKRCTVRFLSSNPDHFNESLNEYKNKAERWFAYLQNICKEFDECFIRYLPIYDALIELLSLKHRSAKGNNTISSIKRFFANYSQEESQFSEKVFDKNISRKEIIDYQKCKFKGHINFILSLQSQNILYIVNDEIKRNSHVLKIADCFDAINYARRKILVATKDKHVNSEEAIIPAIRYCYTVTGEELFEKISLCSNLLRRAYFELTGEDYGERELWFRGQKNSTHFLLPSLFRGIKKGKTIGQTLRDNYEEFKFRADGTPERDNAVNYAVSDYIALMQHFGVGTNFMDFTEDAFSSLYFALEGFFDSSKKDHYNGDASLYVFSPYLYNHVVSNQVKSIEGTDGWINPVLGQIKESFIELNKRSSIPNLSIPENEKQFFHFLVNEKSATGGTLSFPVEAEPLLYPIAIHTSKLNPRIKAQYGTFLAFNTFSENLESWKPKTLENIQEEYLQKNKNAMPFLYKLNIVFCDKKMVAEKLRTIGMSTERIYPELEKSGNRVKKLFG